MSRIDTVRDLARALWLAIGDVSFENDDDKAALQTLAFLLVNETVALNAEVDSLHDALEAAPTAT